MKDLQKRWEKCVFLTFFVFLCGENINNKKRYMEYKNGALHNFARMLPLEQKEKANRQTGLRVEPAAPAPGAGRGVRSGEEIYLRYLVFLTGGEPFCFEKPVKKYHLCKHELDVDRIK